MRRSRRDEPLPTDPLARLRGFRTIPDPDLSIRTTVNQMAAAMAKTQRQLGKLADLWQAHVPVELLERTRLASMHRGQLTVEVTDAATLYELDRLLRAGLERTLRQQLTTASLTRIKLKIGSFEEPTP